LILTAKKIHKYFDKFSSVEKLSTFSLVAEGGPLSFLLDGELSLKWKEEFLGKMIVELEETKR
jgi:hypothetical protein